MSTAEEMLLAKREMEHTILMATAKAVAAFKAATGATPADIDIRMLIRRHLGAPNEHVVDTVVARVEL